MWVNIRKLINFKSRVISIQRLENETAKRFYHLQSLLGTYSIFFFLVQVAVYSDYYQMKGLIQTLEIQQINDLLEA